MKTGPSDQNDRYYMTTTSHIVFDCVAFLFNFELFRLCRNVYGANQCTLKELLRKAVELGFETHIFQIKV